MSDDAQDQTQGQDPAVGTADQPQSQAQVQASAPEDSPVPDNAWDAALARWLNEHVRGSPIAQATEAWNHLNGTIHHLRDYLVEELKKL